MAELLHARMVPVASLTPAPWNPRSIKDPRFQNLCRSLEADREFLWLRPILATADGTVFAGNMRLRSAQHLGWEEVPAVLVDIPEQLAKERAMRDNAQWGEWEEDDRDPDDRLDQCRIDHGQCPPGLWAEDWHHEIDVRF